MVSTATNIRSYCSSKTSLTVLALHVSVPFHSRWELCSLAACFLYRAVLSGLSGVTPSTFPLLLYIMLNVLSPLGEFNTSMILLIILSKCKSIYTFTLFLTEGCNLLCLCSYAAHKTI